MGILFKWLRGLNLNQRPSGYDRTSHFWDCRKLVGVDMYLIRGENKYTTITPRTRLGSRYIVSANISQTDLLKHKQSYLYLKTEP